MAVANALLGGWGGGFNAGNALAQNAADHRRQNQFAQLASQAYGADPQQQRILTSQVIAQSPEQGFALGQSLQADEQVRNQRLGVMARALTAVPEQARPGLYQQMKPELSRFGLSQVPEQYTPEVGQMAEQLAAAIGGASGNTVQSRFVADDGRVMMVMRDGSVVDSGQKADRQMWFRDHPGMDPQLVGKDGQVRTIGQPQQPQQPMAAGEVPFTIDPSLPPEVQASIRANPQQWAQAPAVQIQAGGGGLARPSEAQTAAEVERARQQAQMEFMPAQQDIQTQAALERAAGEAEIQTRATIERDDAKARAEQRRGLPRLRQQLDVLRDAYQGLGTKYTTGPQNALIPDALQSADNQVFLTVVNQAVLDAAEQLTGVISDRDMAFLQQSTMSLNTREEANREILRRKMRIIEDGIQKAQQGTTHRPSEDIDALVEMYR